MTTTETYCKAIDREITLFLRDYGVTQGELAKSLGMSENTLRWKRNGKHEWKLSEIVKLAKVMGVSLDEVLAI